MFFHDGLSIGYPKSIPHPIPKLKRESHRPPREYRKTQRMRSGELLMEKYGIMDQNIEKYCSGFVEALEAE